MSRFGFFVGFGAGYVLGSKAGRERYEQLSRLYDNVTASPAFRQLTGRARDAVGTGFEQAKDKASEGVSKVTDKVKGRDTGTDGKPGIYVAPPPSS